MERTMLMPAKPLHFFAALALLALACTACSGKTNPMQPSGFTTPVPSGTAVPTQTVTLFKNGTAAAQWLQQFAGIGNLGSGTWASGTASVDDGADTIFLYCVATASGNPGVEFYLPSFSGAVNADGYYPSGSVQFDILMGAANAATSNNVTISYGRTGSGMCSAELPVSGLSTTVFMHESLALAGGFGSCNDSSATNVLEFSVDNAKSFVPGVQFYLDNVVWY
jgi:hypothetical protein